MGAFGAPLQWTPPYSLRVPSGRSCGPASAWEFLMAQWPELYWNCLEGSPWQQTILDTGFLFLGIQAKQNNFLSSQESLRTQQFGFMNYKTPCLRASHFRAIPSPESSRCPLLCGVKVRETKVAFRERPSLEDHKFFHPAHLQPACIQWGGVGETY